MRKSICLGLLAHVDAGKTTLSEAILYKTGEIRKLGRVDHGDSYLDANEMERNRGITVFSKQAAFHVGETDVTMLDTPGHVDFSAEMERVLSVIDYALLIVSASEGVQSHTETLWRLLKNRGIPVLVFVNKTDLAVRDNGAIIAELRAKFGDGFFDCSKEGDDLLDEVTLASSDLAAIALEQGFVSDNEIAAAVSERSVFPCCFGSALKLDGIESLLDCIDRFTVAPHYKKDAPFGAKVFKVQRDHNDERLTFMRLTGGKLSTREILNGTSPNGEKWQEKVNQIRIYSGMKYETVGEVAAGSVCAVTGLSYTISGDALGDAEPEYNLELEPFVMHSIISATDKNGAVPDSAVLLNDFKQFSEENPQLHIAWDCNTGEITLRLMGQMQLEILQQMMADRYGYQIEFGPAKVVYKETISQVIEGAGHFEPLRHYAEVHLILEPAERGSGITIDSIAPEDALARNWQRLILTHLEEKEHSGTLIGAPITDMKITLAAGRAHDKHTTGGDFREATYRALRHGLMRARAENAAILLEPYTAFTIEVDSFQVGRIMTDLEQFASISAIHQEDSYTRLIGRSPSGAMMEYLQVFTSITGGQGRIQLKQDGYEECHNADEVIAASGYNPERDLNNPADSVFVSHSGSDIVNWSEAMKYMHIQPVLKGNSIADTSRDIELTARREAYGKIIATDAELKTIFERTYGKVRKSIRKPSEHRSYQPETTRNEARNAEIREKHRHNANTGTTASAPDIVLIDGYNLINSDLSMSEMIKQDIGAARDMLIDRLINYQGFMQCEVIVVFDAYKVHGAVGEEDKIFGVKIIYTAQDEPADIKLGLIAATYDKKKTVRIVSSDALVQQNALVNGALRVASPEFLGELRTVEEEISTIINRQ